MRKALFLTLSLASLTFAPGAMAAGAAGMAATSYGEPVLTAVSVSFPDSSTTFRPNASTAELLAEAKSAAIIYVSGRTSTLRPSAADEALALRRALSARQYLIARGVSPLKIMVNFASASDFVADNSTPEGRYENQRVDIEVIYVPAY
ncbi:OmpA family protein [Xanthomonas euvesicatoria]|uniref:OmpA family protein n=1 Tax=Xanthomonas euvesicatoria TaxID=456327 RepID=UPI001C476A3F|nr:OmpA family protein [Xanthomonas euvesicatoria]MBV6831284.1 OmpA family protein [Xanthomonas campestris pv. viegasii]